MNVNDPPPILWHYCPSEVFLAITKSGFIHASNPRFGNDPTEGIAGLPVIEKLLKGKSFADERRHRILDGVRAVEEDPLRAPLFISFSSEGDELSQWRAYGGNCSGVSMGFSFASRSRFAKLDECLVAGKLGSVLWRRPVLERVRYDEPGQMLLAASVLDKFEALGDEVLAAALRLACFFMKKHAFEAEEEWRYMVSGVLLNGKSQAIPDLASTVWLGSSQGIQWRFPVPIRGCGDTRSVEEALEFEVVRLGASLKTSDTAVESYLGRRLYSGSRVDALDVGTRECDLSRVAVLRSGVPEGAQ